MADLPTLGQHAGIQRTFSRADIDAFAELSGDRNALHLDDAAARAMGFDGRVVHGALVGSLISRILGTILPGEGTIYLSQDLDFRRPVYPGVAVSAAVEVTSVREDKPILELRTWVESGGEVVIEGRAVVMVRRPA